MRWSVVIPVFNEASFLPRTLRSLFAQEKAFRLIIVDNGSTDDGIVAARALCATHQVDALFLHEPTPGQVHALACGIKAVDTELVAICDADTWYPPHYLTRAEALFKDLGGDCVATAAYLLPERANGWRAAFARLHKLGAARLMPRQNHTSGAAHCFRTAVLRRAGGYDAGRWPYVLKDHELMHRVLQHGRQAYSRDLWCISSDRRQDRRKVRWTLSERLAYHLIPFRFKDHFFYGFLGPRFAARGQADTILRDRSWDAAPSRAL